MYTVVETDVNVKDGGFADDDEILLNIDTELQQEKQQHSPDFNKIFESSKHNILLEIAPSLNISYIHHLVGIL